MRVILGFGKHLYVWEMSLTKAAVKGTASAEIEDDDDEAAPSLDPTGTVMAHAEISPHAVDEGCRDPRRFGFYGSKG